MNTHHPVVIIGTGPAGLTAAIYTARADLNPLVFEGRQPGGQLTTTTEVENFPGFPEGVMGPELMDNMKNQAMRFNAGFKSEFIVEADLSKRPFVLKNDNGQTYTADAVIIATGASAKVMGLAEEAKLIGRGVSTCATCDGFFYRGKIVHVVGGGDTALEEANFLTKFADKVYLIHRRDAFRGSKPMQDKVFSNPKVEVLWNTEVVELEHEPVSGLTGIKVKNNQNGEITSRKTDGLFYAIGHHPNTEFLKGQIDLDAHGFIQTKNGEPDTNIPGVFACGDVKDTYYRQAISAAGSGCQAAIRAERFLEHGSQG